MRYTENEVTNEIARVLRARLSVTRIAGVVDTEHIYDQLKEFTSITLLLNPDSVFYIGKLARNKLSSLVRQEIDLVEDMLAALEFVPRISTEVGGTVYLANATTALLNLGPDEAIENRPELQVFGRNLNKFLEGVRTNVAASNGQLARPREESRDLIRADLERLHEVHDRLVRWSKVLQNLLVSFSALDVPNKAASTIFDNVRVMLRKLQEDILSSDVATNAARSRTIALKGLTAKSLVDLVSGFRNPTSVKYRGPFLPIPADTAYSGRVRGQGTPGQVITSSGPWSLPLDDLQLKVDGGAVQSIPLSSVLGQVFQGETSEPFSITDKNRFVHVIVDTQIDNYTSIAASTVGSVTVAPNRWMGFRHLGSNIQMPEMSGTNQYPRALSGLDSKASGVATVSWNPTTKTITIAGAFHTDYVGFILNLPGQRFEITSVANVNEATIDPRNLTPVTGLVAYDVQGILGTEGSVDIIFSPSLTVAATAPIHVGPTYRTGVIDAGTVSAATVVSNLNRESPPVLLNQLAPLVLSVQALVDPLDNTRVVLMLREAVNPFAQISISSLDIDSAVPSLPVIRLESAHNTLGLQLGDSKSDNVITPRELSSLIQGYSVDVISDVVGDSVILQSANHGRGSSIEIVSAPGVLGLPTGPSWGTLHEFEAIAKSKSLLDFGLAIPGDVLKVTGQEERVIEKVEGTVIEVSPPLPANVTGQPFEVLSGSERQFRQLSDGIETIFTSPNLLGKHRFSESLGNLDRALAVSVIIGRSFVSNLNQSRQMLADLLASLTTSPRRTAEYSITIPNYGTSLEDVLQAYDASVVGEIDNLLTTLIDFKYVRAYDLLSAGDLEQFFSTTEETASYAGALVDAMRVVNTDLPSVTRNDYNVELSYDIPKELSDLPSALVDFSDTVPDRENYDD